MPSYEVVASLSLTIDSVTTDEPARVGMTFPGPGGATWRVTRIEEANDRIYDGAKAEPHKRLYCVIE